MSNVQNNHIQIGYIPLLDCVALLWAEHRGFYQELGLNVSLVREASWASLRDRLAFGFLDAAHCLSAMLPAAAIGQDQIGIPLKTSLVLSQNSAYITLSQKLCFDLDIRPDDAPLLTAQKITQAIQNQQQLYQQSVPNSIQPVKFAHVFRQSIHHYCLREWLALADPDIAKNIQLSTLPPPYMAEALSNHHIDGFCVGEPWNTQAEIMGTGHKILSSREIIPNIADKVLAFTADWANTHLEQKNALIHAIRKAQIELETLDDFSEVWKLLVDFKIIQFECSEEKHVKNYHAIQNIIRQFVSHDAIPQAEDFVWLISQMQKWDDLKIDQENINQISQNCIYTASN